MDIENVRKGAALLREGTSVLSGGPLEYYLTELVAAHDLLMQRFAPIKVGDRVVLAKTPVVTETTAWGWLPFKHCLIEGAPGVVREAGCGSKGFWYEVELDRNTYISHHTNEEVQAEKGTFRFHEGDIALLVSHPKIVPKEQT